MDDESNKINITKPFRMVLIFSILAIVSIFILSCNLFSAPRSNNPATIHVSAGESLTAISSDLASKQVIRHPNIFQTFVYLFKSDKQILKGDYLFERNSSVWKVAWQIARGKHNINPIKITFKEGTTNEDMANLLESKLINFNKNEFLNSVSTKQGYLFPDTYFYFPLSTNDEVVSDLTSNFNKKIQSLNKEISSSGKNLNDIITMASILEKEARGKDDAPTISGILWSRIKRGMLLQVDASPYTYIKKGLPDEPIANPGISTIEAALRPVNTTYLFYLHDKNGMVHYSNTYKEHMKNINLYLK